ncbi:MAG: hypothetical protein ACFFBD_22590 [Candidatus Hodarchaeota archaeon]
MSVKLLHFRKLLLTNLIAVIVLSIFTIPLMRDDYALDSCTIFSISRDGKTFFCNNEDEGLRHGRIWFLPGTGEQYGLVLFGYGIYRNLIVPVGGMNDQGLCFDMTAVLKTQILLDSNKPDYAGSYFLDMLRVCATVEQAKLWLTSFNLLLLHWQQAHIADNTGDAVVIGLDDGGEFWMTNKSEDYLISVNVNLAQNSDYLGPRYETVQSMLNTTSELTLDICRATLQTASRSATMYSYICDQQNRVIYLYSRGDFGRVAILDVATELSKGEHSYDIEKLVSQQAGQPSPDTLKEVTGIIMIGFITTISIVITIVKIKVKRG